MLYSDAYENKKHLRCEVGDMYTKPASDFSLLLKCVLSEMGAGDCPVGRCFVLYNLSQNNCA